MNRLSRTAFKGKALLLVHKNADIDSLGAAIALAELIRSEGGVAKILASRSHSKITSKFFRDDLVELKPLESPSGHYDLAIVVDAGTSYMLDWVEALKRANRKMIIDHHPPDDDFLANFDIKLVDVKASSTCELVGELYRKYQVSPSPLAAKAIMGGILYDSQNLKRSSCRTMAIMSWLCKFIDLSETRQALMIEIDRSERIAKLKAAKRIVLYSLGNYVMATSEVGSFQASAARGLINLGADIAFVSGRGDTGLRVSGRSTDRFYMQTRLHIGEDIMKPLATKLGGYGGGHPTAATLNVKANWNDIMEMIIRAVAAKLGTDLGVFK